MARPRAGYVWRKSTTGGVIATCVLVSGCLEDSGAATGPSLFSGGVATATSWDSASPRIQKTANETAAPDVFSTTEPGLWDGRPSLGGVWVSHVDAPSPERVLVTDPETGKTVAAALFRQDRNQTGPDLRVSSDAAKILGLTPGQPTILDVVALKRVTAGQAAANVAEESDQILADPAADKAEPTDAAQRTAAATAAALAKQDLLAQPDRPTQAPPSAPFVQIGLFSVEENARSAASQLDGAGLQADVTKVKTGNKTLWQLRVGPVATQEALTETLARVKGIGFSDAYATR